MTPSFPVVKFSFYSFAILFAIANAISYYVGCMIHALQNHDGIHPSLFTATGSPSSLFDALACGSDLANGRSFVEFESCHGHLLDLGCVTSRYMIEMDDETGLRRFNQMKQILSWDKVMIDLTNIYYEALVHPSLLIHDNPLRVVVMNDVTGGILREVLKHSMVQDVIFVVPSRNIVSLAQEHLSDWNDCSRFVVNVTSCYDDPRVQVLYSDDPMTWLQNSMTDSVDVVFADATMYVSEADRRFPLSFISFV
jgi:hypothetical protein